MKQDEHLPARITLKRQSKIKEIQQLNLMGRTIDNSQVNLRGVFFKSEPWSTGMQVRRAVKLPSLSWLTTKHAVCRIIFMSYWYFN